MGSKVVPRRPGPHSYLTRDIHCWRRRGADGHECQPGRTRDCPKGPKAFPSLSIVSDHCVVLEFGCIEQIVRSDYNVVGPRLAGAMIDLQKLACMPINAPDLSRMVTRNEEIAFRAKSHSTEGVVDPVAIENVHKRSGVAVEPHD